MSLFESTIRGLSSEGLGVAPHPDGRIFFVSGAWPGDVGIFKIERCEKRYGYAHLEELKKASPDRVTPLCAHQGHSPLSCGGCSWMIGSYESQLFHKSHRLKYALLRAGLLEEESLLKKIWPSEKEWAYRNRAQFKTDAHSLGFVSEKSHQIVPIQKCHVLNEKMSDLLQALTLKLPNEDWKPQPPHVWNFIDVDDSIDVHQVTLNERRPFRQGNTGQNKKMKDWIQKKLESISGSFSILELYAGSGNFTRVLSQQERSQKIWAVEISERALESLSLPRVMCIAGDLSHPKFWRHLAQRCMEANTLLLDPPREGAQYLKELVARLPQLKNIFYISCDTATFVRDAVQLKKLGAQLIEIQPLDLFPQTPHLESLAHFRLN